MPDVGKLISGYRDFRATRYNDYKDTITHVMNQNIAPSTMIITTSDLVIAPGKLLSSNPGELYVFRNLGGLIAPYGNNFARGVVCGIQHAVGELGVKNIIVLGHSHNAGIKTMLERPTLDINAKDPMEAWLAIGKEAKDIVQKQMPKASFEEQEDALEHEVILLSVRNLLTYPWIQAKVDDTKGKEPTLDIFAWHFNTEDGILSGFDPNSGDFISLA